MRFIVPVYLVISVLLLSGCGDRELVAGLDEQQSIGAMLALYRAGVANFRELDASARNHSYRIFVPKEAYAKGLEVVGGYGFPRDTEGEIDETLKNSTLLPPGKDVGQLRIDRALSLQAERLIHIIPGIVDARVLVYGGKSTPGDRMDVSAVVVLRRIELPNSAIDSREIELGKIRDIIRRTVRGIESNRIEIFDYPAIAPSSILPVGLDEAGVVVSLVKLNLFSFRVPEQDLLLARSVIVAVVVIFGVFTFILGLIFGSSYMSGVRLLISQDPTLRYYDREQRLTLIQKITLLSHRFFKKKRSEYL